MPSDEDGDDEHPDASVGATSLKIQRLISDIVDTRRTALAGCERNFYSKSLSSDPICLATALCSCSGGTVLEGYVATGVIGAHFAVEAGSDAWATLDQPHSGKLMLLLPCTWDCNHQ